MKATLIALGGAMGMGSIVLALWLWQRQAWLAEMLEPTHPAVLKWSIRCLSIGLVAAAEMTLLAVVIGAIYRRTVVERVMEYVAAGTFAICLVSALALGLAGK